MNIESKLVLLGNSLFQSINTNVVINDIKKKNLPMLLTRSWDRLYSLEFPSKIDKQWLFKGFSLLHVSKVV